MIHASVRSSSSKDESNTDNFVRQGSLRRVLSSSSSSAQNNAEQPDSGESVNGLRGLFYQEFIILAEYFMLQSENLAGLYVIPSKESSFMWFGVVFVRSGLYENAVFRFSVFLPETFPDCACPKIMFTSKVYHPVVDFETGELNLSIAFPAWKQGESHIWQILKFLHWSIHNVRGSLKHAINTEAKDLLENDHEKFKEKADDCIKSSLDHLYDTPPTDDQHYITFGPYDPEKHDPVKEKMLQQQTKRMEDGYPSKSSWSRPLAQSSNVDSNS